MQDFDFHTHRPDTPVGSGIVCLPKAVVLDADAARWTPAPGGLYAAGIHPWWTQDADFSLAAYLRGLERLLEYPEVVQLGECGLDRLRGAAMAEQLSVFRAQAELSERHAVPMTLHCVRAFDLILQARKAWHPRQTWTIHGFRGMASTMLNECGKYRHDVIEAQLAHGERNKVRGAYNHAQYLPERTAMMQEWADWLDRLRNGK